MPNGSRAGGSLAASRERARAGSRGGLSVGGAAWERAGGHGKGLSSAEPKSPRAPARGSVTWPVGGAAAPRSNTVPAAGQRFGRAACRGSSSPTTARPRRPAPPSRHTTHTTPVSGPAPSPRASARGCAGWPRTRRVPHRRCRYDGEGDRRGPVRAGGIGRAVPGKNHGGTAARGPENTGKSWLDGRPWWRAPRHRPSGGRSNTKLKI